MSASINALIAQGGRPLGADVPEIANMLNQRAQQTLQNNRLATQDQYAAEEHAQKADAYDREKTDRDALQTNGESSRLLQIKDPNQFVTTLQAMPHVVEGLQKAGVDLHDLNAVRSHVQAVYQATAAHLNQAQPKPQEVSPGASLVQPGQNPGDPYSTLFTAPKEAPPVSYQKTDSGLTFNPADGTYKDSSGRTLSSREVASREAAVAGQKSFATTTASSKAKLDSMPKDGMDYWVEWSLQHGGNAPPGSRSPQFLASFGLAMKQRALQDGNPVAAQIADARIKQNLTPAIAQTEKQIAANSGFVKTLEKNIASANGLEQQLGGADSPVINKAYNQWKKGVTGDPQTAPIIAKLDFWNNSIQGEAAKIASGGVGSVGASSDTQIAKQVHNLNTAQSYKVWRGVADAMQEEGHNRMDGLNSTIQDFRSQSIGGPPPPPKAAGGVVKHKSGATYEIVQ